jgi:hypothetical protein
MRIRLLISMLCLAVPLQAQLPWNTNLPQRGFALDLLRPKFQGGGTTLTSFAAYASARLAAGNMLVRIEVPFARVAADLTGSSTSFGNPYIGIETSRETGLGFEVGGRVPLASETESAVGLGSFADIVRTEAFLPNTLTLVTRARYRVREANGFTFDAGGGPSLWVPTKGGGDPELILHHHMAAGFRGPNVWGSLGFAGWTILTEDAGGVANRTVNEVGASVGLASGQVRPALHLIVPLDDEYNQAVGIVLGFGVAMALR